MARGQVLIRATVTLLDPEHLGAQSAMQPLIGLTVGKVTTGGADLVPGTPVAAFGPVAEVVAVDGSAVQSLSDISGTEASEVAIGLFATSLDAALAAVALQPGEAVLVSGAGLTARLAAALTARRTGMPPGTTRSGGEMSPADGTIDGEVDVLIDATADPLSWTRVLPRVRPGGRVLFTVPPRPAILPFDFYPSVHRRSLVLQCRRVPDVRRAGSPAGSDLAFLRAEDLVIAVAAEHVIPAGWGTDGGASAGRGLLLRWGSAA